VLQVRASSYRSRFDWPLLSAVTTAGVAAISDDDADDRDALHETPPSVHDLHGSNLGGDRLLLVRAGVTGVTHFSPRESPLFADVPAVDVRPLL
jgi:hypothetical protein